MIQEQVTILNAFLAYTKRMDPTPPVVQPAAAPTVPSLCISRPPAPQLSACVIIPAKDEAQRLPATLAALANQLDLTGSPLDTRCYEVLVLANNCRDKTAAVVRRFARQHPQLALHVVEIELPPAAAHVGQARRLLMDEACRRLEQSGNRGAFIASTDGDTCVAPDWLAAIRAELGAGADAVGGRILTLPTDEATSSVRRLHLRDAAYRLLRARLETLLDPDPADPWPRHHQHFGANFALTTRAYRLVGGLPVVPYLEDEALFRNLRHHDLRVRHSPAVCVRTSDRQQGRVAIGLSWQLREWSLLEQQKREPLVESGAQLVAEWVGRQQLRVLWQATAGRQAASELLTVQQQLLASEAMLLKEQTASRLGVAAGALTRQLQQGTSFWKLWDWVQQQQNATTRWARRWPPVPLSQALAELRQLVRHHEAQCAGQPLALLQ